jgi:transposase-like protein
MSRAKINNTGASTEKDNREECREIIIKCPYCDSEHVVRNGNKYNKQRYLCKNCHKSFSLSDSRIKRENKQRELCLLLYSHNSSLRSIQNVLNKFFNTNIAYNVIDNWLKTSAKLMRFDLARKEKEKPRTINILELDELYSYFYDIKKNKKNILKYGLLLIGTEIKLLRLT